MVDLNEADIARYCGDAMMEAGRRCHHEARIVAFLRDQNTIRSAVKGRPAELYRQVIMLSDGDGDIEIRGRCTCQTQAVCEHVAAALVHAVALGSSAKVGKVEIPEPHVAKRPPGAIEKRSSSAMAGSTASDLPTDLKAWIEDIACVAGEWSEADAAGVDQRLVYLLMPIRDDPRMQQLGVHPVSARLRRDGRYASNSRPYALTSVPSGGATWFRPLDHRIMRELARLPAIHEMVLYRLTDIIGADVLAIILATGRARWLTLDGPALSVGLARRGILFWDEIEAGVLLPRLRLDEEGVVLAGTPAVYVDPRAGIVGPVETGLPAPIVKALFRAPPVAATALAALNWQLAHSAPTLAGLVPSTPVSERRRGVKPVPCLRLFTAPLPADVDQEAARPYEAAFATQEAVALARLSFRYGDVATPAGETKRAVTVYAEGRLVEVQRDVVVEAEAARLLLSHDFRPVSQIRGGVPASHARDLVPGESATEWLSALYDVLPELRSAGWDVTVAPGFPHRIVQADGGYDAELRESSGIDWFEFHLGVTVDGERVDLIEPLVALIGSPGFSLEMLDGLDAENGEPVFLPLKDGRALAVPLTRLRPMIEVMRELAFGLDRVAGSLRLSALDAARLADFEAATAGAKLQWRGGDAVRALGRKLTAAGGISPVAVPPEFLAALRPYQAEGVAWLSLLREVGLGGILADDMGLGKTVQALAFVSIEKAAGRLDRPALVVAPTSLMSNWAREAERFAPDLRVLTLHGLSRRALFDSIPDHDLVLTTYPLVARDREVLAAQEWHVLLLDEAQTIKNPEAATTKLILSLDARHRFCLIGTPLENNLGELWSLFSFACPGLLGNRKSFVTTWRTPIEKGGDDERGSQLARRVRPFLLRRTKEEVARDLPPKTEMVEHVELGAAQRDIYESVRLSMHERIRNAIAEKGWARSRIELLDALLKLRQVCCDPRLLKLETEAAASAGSAKLERLEEMLRELLAEGRRVLVFSQFTSMLDLIRPRLDTAGIRYALLTGSTHDRPAAIAAFDSGAAQVFLISLRAGGVGLNLVSADTVVLYDPWWNPAVENQAIDRAHRIGQMKPVFVH